MIAHARPLALLAAVLAATLAAAAPVPKQARKGEYFPTAVGTRWEYVTESDGAADHAREVTDRSEKDGGVCVTFAWTSYAGQYTKKSEYRVDTAGVQRVGWGDGQRFDTPCVLFKADARPGDTWDGGITSRTPAEFTATRDADEEVATPAGKFVAAPVSLIRGHDTNTYWYAPGVGLVKWRHGNGKVVVLGSYTPGK